MLVIIGISLTIFFGFLISLLVMPKMSAVERIGLSYITGIGLQTFLMFISAFLGFKTDVINTFGLLILLILILLFFVKKSVVNFWWDLKKTIVFPPFTPLEKIILTSIIILLGYSFIVSIYWPVNDWDSLALYDYRAKIFAETGNIIGPAKDLNYFLGYPFLTSLSQAWVYLLQGRYSVFIYSLFFISFILMFYAEIRKNSSRKLSLLALLMLVTMPTLFEHSMMAYTNLPYTVYLVMGTIYLYRWIIDEGKRYVLLSALMMGLSTWTRSFEPFWLVILGFVILFSFWKKTLLAPLIFGLAFFLLQQPWKIFSSGILGSNFSTVSIITDSTKNVISGFDVNALIKVTQFLYTNVIVFWQPILWLFLAAVWLKRRNFLRSKLTLFLLLIFGYFLTLVAGAYMFTFMFPEWKDIPGSASRMAMFFPVLFVFYIFSFKLFNLKNQ